MTTFRALALAAPIVLTACGAPGPRPPAVATSAPQPPAATPASPPASDPAAPAVEPSAPAAEPGPEAPAEAGRPAVTRPDPSKRYALVVSFFSPGHGTDGEAYERLSRVVAREEASRLGHVHGHWGKEGEHDECFTLDGLSAAEKRAFIRRVRDAIGWSTRTHVEENVACRNERD